MSVFIAEKHLLAGEERKTYSDNKQLGFALRTTPNLLPTPQQDR